MTTEKAKTPAKKTTTKVENEKTAAILAYFLVGIIWYFVDEKMQKSSLAKYHVKQAIHLLIISVAINVIGTVLAATIFLIPLLVIALPIVGIGLLVVAIMGLIHAINGEEKPVPVIGGFAEKYLKF